MTGSRQTRILAAFALVAAGAATPANAGQCRLFVSNEHGDDIAVINPFSGGGMQILSRIKVCSRPRDMEWGPDGTLYVACGSSDAIGVVDVDAGEMVSTIDGVPQPEAFAIDRSGVIYVTNENDDLLSRIRNGGGGLHARTARTATEPEGVTLESDESRVWVTTEAASLIHVFEADTLDLVADILVSARPRRVVARPHSKEVWASAELAQRIDIIDADSLTVVGEVDLDNDVLGEKTATPVGIGFMRDGETAYVALGRGDGVAKIDADARQVSSIIETGARPWNLALDEAGGRIYVANGLSGTVSAIALAENEVIGEIETGKGPYDILLERDRYRGGRSGAGGACES